MWNIVIYNDFYYCSNIYLRVGNDRNVKHICLLANRFKEKTWIIDYYLKKVMKK